MIEKTPGVIREKIEQIGEKFKQNRTKINSYFTKTISILYFILIVIIIIAPILISVLFNSPLKISIANLISISTKDMLIEPSEINEQITQGNFTIQTLVIKNKLGTDLYNVTLAEKWFWPINFSYNNFSNNISFNLKDNTNEYVLVNISIPKNESPGEYKGEIQIKGYYALFFENEAFREVRREVPISITVPDLRTSNKTSISENKTIIIINK